MARRLPFLVWLVIAVPLLLEVVLQVGAAVVWLTHRESQVDAQQAAVLCIGDSFTYGVGTSSPDGAYPTQLDRLLQTARPGLRAAKHAWPGWNSREVLESLAGALASVRPKLVYVMVGRNDFWAKPEQLAGGAEEQATGSSRREAFSFELRTLRFARWLLGRNAPDPQSTNWLPDTGTPIEAQTAALEGRIAAADSVDESAALRAEITILYVGAGQIAKAQEHVEWLRQQVERTPSNGVVTGLLGALEATGANDERFAFAKQVTERYPDYPEAWHAWAWEAYQRGDMAAAAAAIKRAAELVPDDVPGWKANVLARQAIIWQTIDRPFAVQSSVRAARLLKLDPARGWIAIRCTREEVQAACAALDVPAEERPAVEAFFARVLGWIETPFEAVLENHLLRIVALCRGAGAEPVLLDYPVEFPWVLAGMRRVESAASVAHIVTEPRFLARTGGRDRAEFLAADGHCNDAGYRVLAEIVAEDALARLGVRQ